eukprot:gb/GEZN01001387.1/.p1 GENE.gb/GEZN01001387.1/~~gb/GEZN01001387.1/.p1  ORF type:complete len:947 (-),score=88.86 gb/GEZN01001387.1/:173-3013(-)
MAVLPLYWTSLLISLFSSYYLTAARSTFKEFYRDERSPALGQLPQHAWKLAVVRTPHWNDHNGDNHHNRTSLPKHYFLNRLDAHPVTSRFFISHQGHELRIELEKQNVYGDNYQHYEQVWKDGKLIAESKSKPSASQECHYHGDVYSATGAVGIAAVSTCSGGFKGFIRTTDGVAWAIEPAVEHVSRHDISRHLQSLEARAGEAQPLNTTSLHVIIRQQDMDAFVETDDTKEGRSACGVRLADVAAGASSSSSSFFPPTPPTPEYQANFNTSPDGLRVRRRQMQATAQKHVELMIVNDEARIKRPAFGTAGLAQDRAAIIVNQMNAIYTATNFNPTVDITLVAQVSWSQGDPYVTKVGDPTCLECGTSEVSVSDLLEHFHNWRRSGLGVPDHDNAHLLSGFDFQSSVLGYANVGSMCQFSQSGGVDQMMDISARDAAVVSHELGHNFGMSHDSSGNTCQNSGFIMNAVLATIPDTFSTCSLAYYQSTVPIIPNCLDNVPTSRWGQPVCGNGVVDQGEKCDCGAKTLNSNCGAGSCCNGTTCQLLPGSACDASAPCCNEQCQFIKLPIVCREALSECDVAETCNGLTDECPPDWYLGPGTLCEDKTGACYNGFCYSATKQCEASGAKFGDTFLACDQKFALDQNSGSYCKKLWCAFKSNPAPENCVIFPMPDGGNEAVNDGVPCPQIGGGRGQCLRKQCVGASALAVDLFWQPRPWGSCSTCQEPQLRNVECVYHPVAEAKEVLVNQSYCTPTDIPGKQQRCDNVTLGCIHSGFANGQINVFGFFTLGLTALSLAGLGVVTLSGVAVIATFYAVTYESNIHDGEVKKIKAGKYTQGQRVQEGRDGRKRVGQDPNQRPPPSLARGGGGGGGGQGREGQSRSSAATNKNKNSSSRANSKPASPSHNNRNLQIGASSKASQSQNRSRGNSQMSNAQQAASNSNQFRQYAY